MENSTMVVLSLEMRVQNNGKFMLNTCASNFLSNMLKLENNTLYNLHNFIFRFFEAYRANGLNFWGMTVQNEPMTGWDPVCI